MDDERILRAGDRLDRYELLAPIASGGMASVWLAQLRGKRGFEKLFAIKTIKTDLTDDPRFQEMFLDEARIASGIQHPNVAQILDLGEQDDLLYIVMEWVDGDSLAHIRRLALKKDKPFPLDIMLRVFADACAGLHAAHELRDVNGTNLGVVHRDVSPHNIIVSSAGSVKVIDFGVAKARNRRAGDTSTGVIKGKIRYMAPEQVQGRRAVDRRADVWAIGVCLYQFVTGELPFDDESDVDVIRRLLDDEPPPRPTGAVPEPIEELLAHSLVRDPDERFATAAAMQRAIEAAIDELRLRATNDDVAAFLRATVPELEDKRRETVAKALDAAHARQADAPRSGSVVRTGGGGASSDDEALAPTVVQASSPSGGATARSASGADASKTVLVPKEKDRTKASSATGTKRTKKARSAARSRDESKAARDESKATLVGASVGARASGPAERRSPLAWVLAIALVAAGAWFGWPGQARIMAWLSPAKIPEPPAAAAATPPRPAPAPTPAAATPKATVEAVIPARVPAQTATPTSSATPAASAAPSSSTRTPSADAGARKKIRRPKRPIAAPGSAAPAEAPPAADDEPDDTPY